MNLEEYTSLLPIFSSHVVSYGYEPKFSVFHKNYPVGLTDGIDF